MKSADPTRPRAMRPQFGKLFHEQLSAGSDPDDPKATEHLVRQLIADALRERVSDIHLDPMETGLCVRFRIDGSMWDVAHVPPPGSDRLVGYFKVNSDLNPGPSFLPEDSHMRLTVGENVADLRLASAPCIFGEKLTLRILQRSNVRLRLSDLGLAKQDQESIEQWVSESAGMFLVVGAVGSGKTTTLYALLHAMHLMQRSITTIEDPIEYQIEKINQIEVDPKRGLTFSKGLRSILRLDPDLILLGEIRDNESAATAVEAANSGRALLTTMHSRDAAAAVAALRDLGVRDQEIAAALSMVVAQRLIRKLCPHCRIYEPPGEAESAWLKRIGEPVPANVWRAPGCSQCKESGYSGRTGIFEVWPFDAISYELVRTGAHEDALRRHMSATGAQFLLTDGLQKAAAGITDLSEIRALGVHAYRPHNSA